jgi:hypothetical protein
MHHSDGGNDLAPMPGTEHWSRGIAARPQFLYPEFANLFCRSLPNGCSDTRCTDSIAISDSLCYAFKSDPNPTSKPAHSCHPYSPHRDANACSANKYATPSPNVYPNAHSPPHTDPHPYTFRHASPPTY